ncbi:response regulator [Marinobacter sp. F3R11]|uniref:response regulator n=1 Tax=Marinobacter sp. F3R11 TaxID=2267231 RepID=UPI000DEBD539|nr:response regulator [Marinobacter sp. F3R11]RBW48063.1 hypothetical protein DS878_15400 [Marinobacter sp. F3R11]
MNAQEDFSTVSVIDQDSAVREGLSALLGTMGVTVTSFKDAQSYLDFAASQVTPDSCIIVEAELGGVGILEFLKRLRAKPIMPPVLVMVSRLNTTIADLVLSAGASDLVNKPLVSDDLLQHLHQALKKVR